jgi:hypothetical protein
MNREKFVSFPYSISVSFSLKSLSSKHFSDDGWRCANERKTAFLMVLGKKGYKGRATNLKFQYTVLIFSKKRLRRDRRSYAAP